MAQSSKVIEVSGARYIVTRFVGQTYSVRSTPNGEVIGVFALDETEARVVGVEGADVPLTLEVARAMLEAATAPGSSTTSDGTNAGSPDPGNPRRSTVGSG